MNSPAAPYASPVGAQSQPGPEDSGPQGRPHPVAQVQNLPRHGSVAGSPGPPPPPPPPGPRPVHAGLAPGAAASFWTSAGQGRPGPADSAFNWRPVPDRGQAGPYMRQDPATDSQPRRDESWPRRSFDRQRPVLRPPQRNVHGQMGARPFSPDSSTTGSMGSEGGYASAVGGQPAAARRLQAAYPPSLLNFPVATQPPHEAQAPAAMAPPPPGGGLRRPGSAPSLRRMGGRQGFLGAFLASEDQLALTRRVGQVGAGRGANQPPPEAQNLRAAAPPPPPGGLHRQGSAPSLRRTGGP